MTIYAALVAVILSMTNLLSALRDFGEEQLDSGLNALSVLSFVSVLILFVVLLLAFYWYILQGARKDAKEAQPNFDGKASLKDEFNFENPISIRKVKVLNTSKNSDAQELGIPNRALKIGHDHSNR